jgi:hypothetical protein
VLGRLARADYEVGHLSGGLLGYTYAGARTVVLDSGADGYGWFLGSSPQSDAEFSVGAPGSPLTALPGTAAAGHMDLLTVVLHEMGHLAGKHDVAESGTDGNLMSTLLAAGVRRTNALDAVFATG